MIKQRRRRVRDKTRDYVSGPVLHEAIVEYYEILRKNNDKENPPEPSPVIVQGITQICKRLGTRGNFSGYTYIDEMIAEGTLSCIAALINQKYNPEKSNANPFGYFSRIAWNAFIQVIKNEHKEVYIKHKEFENYIIESSLKGEVIEVEVDDSGRLDTLVNKFEGNKKNE